ncbi:MAG: signal peptidase I [Bacilli bacterium]|nr:signal peptidase I [Bacilli bacterium]
MKKQEEKEVKTKKSTKSKVSTKKVTKEEKLEVEEKVVGTNPLKKAFKIVKSIINFVVIVGVVLFVFIVCLQRFSNNRVSFFNYRLFTVVSGSMEPEYEIGDVLIAKEKDPATIKVGDTISYLGTIGQFNDKVITHRVVNIERDKDGKYLFHTKGDANLIEDPIVSQDKLYGVVIYKTIILSNIYRVVGTSIGMFVFVVLPILYIIGSEFISFLVEKEDERRKQYNAKKKAN